MELNRPDRHLVGKTGILNVSPHFDPDLGLFLTLHRDLLIA